MHTLRRFCIILGLLLVSGCGAAAPNPTAILPTDTALSPADTPTSTVPPTEAFTAMPEFTATPAATPTLGIGSTMGSAIDHLVMVYVPAGSFTMGYNGGYGDEGPEHTVTLGAYWIDKTEVPNGAYGLCVQAGDCKAPAKHNSNGIDYYFGNPQYADYPVLFVSWKDAQNYCDWAGQRLPTEAEWEKAARGTDGRMYPWGNTAPDPSLADFGNNKWDVVATGNYPGGASPFGALDMAGNVWEWVSDWYGADYYKHSPAENPTGPDSGTLKVLRGGSWNFDAPGLRTSYRLSKEPTYVSPDAGFRCVQPVQ